MKSDTPAWPDTAAEPIPSVTGREAGYKSPAHHRRSCPIHPYNVNVRHLFTFWLCCQWLFRVWCENTWLVYHYICCHRPASCHLNTSLHKTTGNKNPDHLTIPAALLWHDHILGIWTKVLHYKFPCEYGLAYKKIIGSVLFFFLNVTAPEVFCCTTA